MAVEIPREGPEAERLAPTFTVLGETRGGGMTKEGASGAEVLSMLENSESNAEEADDEIGRARGIEEYAWNC